MSNSQFFLDLKASLEEVLESTRAPEFVQMNRREEFLLCRKFIHDTMHSSPPIEITSKSIFIWRQYLAACDIINSMYDAKCSGADAIRRYIEHRNELIDLGWFDLCEV